MILLYNTFSGYPDSIDDLVFISDVSLDTCHIYTHFQQLLSQNKYTEAYEYINQQSDITPVTADFFNMLQHRIRALQQHLTTKSKPTIISIGDTCPTDSGIKIWIGR